MYVGRNSDGIVVTIAALFIKGIAEEFLKENHKEILEFRNRA